MEPLSAHRRHARVPPGRCRLAAWALRPRRRRRRQPHALLRRVAGIALSGRRPGRFGIRGWGHTPGPDPQPPLSRLHRGRGDGGRGAPFPGGDGRHWLPAGPGRPRCRYPGANGDRLPVYACQPARGGGRPRHPGRLGPAWPGNTASCSR